MNTSKQFMFAFITTALVTGAAQATEYQDKPLYKHSVGAGISAYGAGIFYTYKINDSIHIRTSAYGIEDDSSDFEVSGITYDGTLEASSFGLSMDWYPFSQGWSRQVFFSGGLLSTEFDFSGSAQATFGEAITVGSAEVGPGDIDGLDLTLNGKHQVQPYMSIGWGNKPKPGQRWSFISEVGISEGEPPEINLSARDPDGVISEDDLNQEIDSIKSDQSDISGYISIGVAYHF